MIHKKICVVCKREFETNRISAVYCGSLCACKARSIKSLKYVKRVQHAPKACEECGKEFIPKNVKSKYCCPECKKRYYAKQPKKGFAPKKCEYCGNEFIPNSASAKYCCKKCRKAGAKEALNKKTSMHTQNSSSEKKKTKVRSDYPDVPSSKRWEKMSLAERNAESRKHHLTYGQAQGRAYCGTLPEDFGI